MLTIILFFFGALALGGILYIVMGLPQDKLCEKLQTIDQLYGQVINNPQNYIYRPEFFNNTEPNNLKLINLYSINKKIYKLIDFLRYNDNPQLNEDISTDIDNIISDLEKALQPVEDLDFETTETMRLKSCASMLNELYVADSIDAALKANSRTVNDYYDAYTALYAHLENCAVEPIESLPNPHGVSPHQTVIALEKFFKQEPMRQDTEFMVRHEYTSLGSMSEGEWEQYQHTKDRPELHAHYANLQKIDDLYHLVLTNPDTYIHNPELFSSKSGYNLNDIKDQIENKIVLTEGNIEGVSFQYSDDILEKFKETLHPYTKKQYYSSTETLEMTDYAESVIRFCTDLNVDNYMGLSEKYIADYTQLYDFMQARSINPIDLLPDPHSNTEKWTIKKLHTLTTYRPCAQYSLFYKYCENNEDGILSYQGFRAAKFHTENKPSDAVDDSAGSANSIDNTGNANVITNSHTHTRPRKETAHTAQTTRTTTEHYSQEDLYTKIAQLQQSYYHVMTDPEIMITAPIIRDTSYDKVATMEDAYTELNAIIPENKQTPLGTKQHKKLERRYIAAQAHFDTALEYAYTIGLNGISHHNRIRARVLLDKALDPSNEHEAERAYEHLVELLAQVYAEDTETNYKHYFNPTSMPELSAYTTELKSIAQ